MPVPALAARPWQITNANVEPRGGISPCKTPSGNRQPVIRRIMRVSFNQPRRIEFLTQVRESVGLMGRIPRRNKTEFEINSVSSAQGVIVVGLYEIFASENSEIQRALILSTILPFDCCVDVVVVANYPFKIFTLHLWIYDRTKLSCFHRRGNNCRSTVYRIRDAQIASDREKISTTPRRRKCLIGCSTVEIWAEGWAKAVCSRYPEWVPNYKTKEQML